MKLGGTKALSPVEFLVHKKVGGGVHTADGERKKKFSNYGASFSQTRRKERRKAHHHLFGNVISSFLV